MGSAGRGPDWLDASLVATPAGLVGPARIAIVDGLIAAVDRLDPTRPTGRAAPARILAPGFVDLQVNGIDDVDVATATGAGWDRLDRLLLGQGVTSWFPTLVSAPLGWYAAALERIAAAGPEPGAITSTARPQITGVHLEGPFLGQATGAHRREHVVPIDRAWLAALPPAVRLVTLAPEVDGALDAVADLTSRGVTVALGHSTATFDQATAGADAGASLVTHLFNAMGPLHHRHPGLPGAALADDRLTVSLIADLVHVHPALLAATFRAKGPGRVVLVTDAIAARAGPTLAGQRVAVVDGAPRLADGTLAGSVLTMDAAVRNAVAAGVSLDAAVAAASTTPAAIAGLADRGAVEPGRRADLVALSSGLTVEAVWIAGLPAWTA
jgi:N-acetylglucosamine-6-phosphate deacetylase